MVKVRNLPSTIAPALVVGAIAAGIFPLLWFTINRGGLEDLKFDSSLLSIVWFTVKQAFLSTILSLGLGLLAARGLARQRFWGRRFLLNIFAVPQAMPAIVAVLGVVTIYGTTGLLGGAISVYGLAGILMVHVFFNLPLATRLCLDVIDRIAPESFRLAEQLSFSDFATFKHVEWPALRSALPRIGGLIFLLCAASFVVVLTLGGAGATTLEVAIYQSLRMDFDLNRAIALSILQILLSLSLVLLMGRLALEVPQTSLYQKHGNRLDGSGFAARLMDYTFLLIAISIVLPPVMAILFYGLLAISIDTTLLKAAGFSLLIGSLSALVSVGLAWSLARNHHKIISAAGLIVPPAVLATGWFLAVRNFDSSLSLTVFLVMVLNSLMALPFSVAILAEGFAGLGPRHEKLCAQLDLYGWNRFWHIDLPASKPAVLQALLISFIFSVGDLTAVTLLGSQRLITLPALIHQQMGQYRGHEAGGTALVLALLCWGLATLAQRKRFQNDQN
jgi:thiamine transport system permease protein